MPQSWLSPAGKSTPGAIRAAAGNEFDGLKFRGELEVKGMRYQLRLACHQKLNDDGSLTLRLNLDHRI